MKTYTNNKGQVVAYSRANILYKKVKRKKHLFRSGKSYGLDTAILEKLPSEVDTIRLKEEDTGDIFSISLDDFILSGWKTDFGYGEQILCPLKKWTKET